MCCAGPLFFDIRENIKIYFPFYYEKNKKIVTINPSKSIEREFYP